MKTKLIIIILTLCAKLPLRLNHLLGTWLGKLLMLINNEQKRIANINIKKCFPELSPDEQQQLLKQNLIETGKLFFEFSRAWLGDKEHFLETIVEVHGEEHLKQGLEKGNGVILAAPHLGNWEAAGFYISAHYPITNLYRPPRMAGIGKIIRDAREHYNATLVPTTAKGVRALYQALNRNEVVGILPDQDPRESGGLFAPFFGFQANTITLLSRLADKSHATILLFYGERLPDSRGFALHISPAPAEIYDASLEQSVTIVNQMVEQGVRRIPAQYQWGYKRFLTRPEGEKDFYDEV